MTKEVEEEKLDNTWIKEFEKIDKLYQDFYVDDIYYVYLHFIYIKKNMEIEKIKEEIFLMKTPNVISREEIVGLLKRNSYEDNRKYSIFSLLKFNITLKPEDINLFLQKPSDREDFLIPIKHIDDINFHKTISMFHDLNTLYFIFVEKELEMDTNTKKSLTKKIYLHLNSTHCYNKDNKDNKHKKTRRKFY
jgi:hypothetical protein